MVDQCTTKGHTFQRDHLEVNALLKYQMTYRQSSESHSRRYHWKALQKVMYLTRCDWLVYWRTVTIQHLYFITIISGLNPKYCCTTHTIVLFMLIMKYAVIMSLTLLQLTILRDKTDLQLRSFLFCDLNHNAMQTIIGYHDVTIKWNNWSLGHWNLLSIHGTLNTLVNDVYKLEHLEEGFVTDK